MDLSALSSLVNWTPQILILGGAVAVLRLAGLFSKEGARKAIGGFVGFLGFFVGILLLVTGGVLFFAGGWSWDVWSLLLITGLGLTLKPLTKVPFSALLGLVAGLVCVGLLYLYFPLPETILGISSLWLYLVVFLVPALIVFLLFKFVEDLGKFFGLILGSWPVLTVLGFLCLAQGILLLYGSSLLSLMG